MVVFSLELKEEDKELKDIISKDFEGSGAGDLFSKVKDEFSEYLVEGSKDNQPFLYMKITPIKTREGQAASIIPTACFKTDIRDQIINYIEKN